MGVISLDDYRRSVRSSTDKQCEYLDACFAAGIHARKTKYKNSRTIDIKALGGGAGFGGKSYTIRTGITECAIRLATGGVKAPRQVVFRKYATDLEESHIDVIKNGKDRNAQTGAANGLDLLGSLRLTRSNYYEFKFDNPALGVVEFRHGQNIPRRRGAEYDYGWVDELTQFTRDDYEAITYLVRSSKDPPFVGLGMATNPDGVGNGWVKKWWVDRNFDETEEIYESENGIDPDDFVFVPFTVQDNPTNTESAVKMLTSQSEMLKRSRYYGEWDLLTGTRFGIYNETKHLFEWEDLAAHYSDSENALQVLLTPGLFRLYGSFDYGTAQNSASAFHIHAVDRNRRVWTISELYMKGTLLRDQAQAIKEHIGQLKLRAIYCDPALRGIGDDISGLSRIAMFQREGIIMVPSHNDRVTGWSQMENHLYWRQGTDIIAPLSPKWRVHRKCTQLRAFLRNAPRDEHDPEDVCKKFKEDHAGDGPRYFFMGYFGYPTQTKKSHGNNNPSIEESAPIWLASAAS